MKIQTFYKIYYKHRIKKANLLLKEKFDKEVNFKEYIKTIENFNQHE